MRRIQHLRCRTHGPNPHGIQSQGHIPQGLVFIGTESLDQDQISRRFERKPKAEPPKTQLKGRNPKANIKLQKDNLESMSKLNFKKNLNPIKR